MLRSLALLLLLQLQLTPPTSAYDHSFNPLTVPRFNRLRALSHDHHRRHHHPLRDALSERALLPLALSAAAANGTNTTVQCASVYKGSTTISGPGTLPRTSVGGWVSRSNSKLTLAGKTYRIAGPNVYWLGLDENMLNSTGGRIISYPSKQRIREAVAITVAMGGNTIRAQTLGISVGHNLSVWPARGQTNEKAFESIDYAVYVAGVYGVRLVVPLVDNYKYYLGGKYTFLKWRGYNTTQSGVGKKFYSDKNVINDYKQYISVIMNRVNKYTGKAYKDDPTIMAWETGNELGAYDLQEGAPPTSWTSLIAAHIRSLSANALIIDGTNGITYPYSPYTPIPGVKISQIDIVSDHFYPTYTATQRAERDYDTAGKNKKSTLFGEWDWTASQATVKEALGKMEGRQYSGNMAWSLFGHDDECCAFVKHDDSYSIYYPNGNTAALQSNLLLMAQSWHRMTGRTPPSKLVGVKCPQPEV